MNLPVMSTSDTATRAAAEAIAALGVGDTALARQKYAEAGAILEREMKVRHGGGEKQLLRFLAATQYYKGGDYQKAQELAQKIDAGALPKNVRGLLPQFQKDVKLRAAPGYAASIRRTFLGLWRQKGWMESLAVLQEHPYVLPPDRLAFVRAVLCEKLANFRAAALFFASAVRQAPDDLELVLMTAADPLSLPSRGRLVEAWEYARYQVGLLPHPVTYITASIVCYHRAVAASTEERGKRFEEQFTFVQQAWDTYQKLSVDRQNHPDLRGYMAFGFEVAASAWLQQGNKERSKEVWEQAIKLGANATTPWPKRKFATSPNEQIEESTEAKYLSERETHFSERFAPEESIRQRLEMVGA